MCGWGGVARELQVPCCNIMLLLVLPPIPAVWHPEHIHDR
jgi:hypothetical protein